MVESKQHRRHRRQAVQTSVIIGVLSMSNRSNYFASAFSPIPTTAATVSKPDLICGRESINTINFNKSPLYASKRQSPLEDEPWKNDSSYWDSLQAASKDPETFEKFIEESMKREKMSSSSPSHAKAAAAKSSSSSQEGGEDKPKKKSKYVPIEEWNEQQTENMSKEERLQWECQRGGNQFRQNEILTQNLKSF
jgi:hypothetical protein